MSTMKLKLNNLLTIKLSKKENRNFGYLFSIVFLILFSISYFSSSGIILFSHYFLISAGLLFLFFALIFPQALMPLNKMWMAIGRVLAWVNMNLILIITYYFLFTPMSIVLKLLRRDVLDLKIDKSAQTYFSKMSISGLYKKPF